jgi:microcompartment protein CcmK/EutM
LNLGRVIGTIWATRKHPGTEGIKMQLVQPLTGELKPAGSPLAMFDSVGAGEGELVYYVLQYEATLAFDRPLVPFDASIIGLVDRVDDESERVLGGADLGKAGGS